ncbi:MAG: DHH family phosphoesterase, partial [Nitrospinota bacterium]
LKDADCFLLSTHINPDGDGLGSMLALSWALKKMGKRHVMVIDDKVPEMFSYLDGYQDILPYAEGMLLPFSPRCLVALDVSNIERMKRVTSLLAEGGQIINIDHHLSNSNFGDINLVDIKASSCAEVVFNIITGFGFDLDMSTAEAIYTGIAIDTGRFRFAGTTASCMRITGDLIDAGARISLIADRLFYDNSLETIKALSEVLGTASLYLDGQLVVSSLGNDFYEKNDKEKIDTEGFVNYPLTIKGVKVSLLLQEAVKGVVRGSLRSKDDSIDVNDIARIFGGGGHAKAAGFVVNGERLDAVKAKVIDAVKAAL